MYDKLKLLAEANEIMDLDEQFPYEASIGVNSYGPRGPSPPPKLLAMGPPMLEPPPPNIYYLKIKNFC